MGMVVASTEAGQIITKEVADLASEGADLVLEDLEGALAPPMLLLNPRTSMLVAQEDLEGALAPPMLLLNPRTSMPAVQEDLGEVLLPPVLVLSPRTSRAVQEDLEAGLLQPMLLLNPRTSMPAVVALEAAAHQQTQLHNHNH
jgi:hypothetical protein